MYDGTVGTVSGDGAEGKTAKIGVFCAKRGKSLFNGEFRFLCDLAFYDDFIERSAKTHQGHAVQFHRTTETGDLAFVFHRAQSGNGGDGRGANGAQTQFMEMFHDLSVHASGISDECLSYVERTQQLCGAFVRMQRDSVRSQLFLCAFIERFEMNEKVSFAFAHQQVRKENRIEFNVFATEIEQPRDFGNVVVEEISIYGFIVHIRGSCGRRLCHFQRLLDEFVLQLSNDFDFISRFFARPLGRMANNGTFRQRRSVFPNFGGEIDVFRGETR